MKIHRMKINQSLKYAVILGSAILVNSVAHGEPDKTAVANKEETQTPESIILSIVVGDWNDDKLMDSAVLLKSEDQADLYLYFGNATGDMALKLVKKGLVWSGALAGTLPHLKVEKNGGLLVYSENDAIGRNRWHQSMNLDYRDKDFLVTGYSYDSNDTLEPKSSLSCEVNLLTGNGFKNKVAFKIEGYKAKLSEWVNEKAPKQCRD